MFTFPFKQSYAEKCLTTSFSICLFCGVNTPITGNSKLPSWHQEAWKIHESLTTGSSEQEELQFTIAFHSSILKHKVSEEVVLFDSTYTKVIKDNKRNWISRLKLMLYPWNHIIYP